MLEILLESWDRQCQIIDNTFDLVTEQNKSAKPSEDGMAVFEQYAHIHNTRRWWLNNTSPKHLEGYGRSYVQVGEEDWKPITDLHELRGLLKMSAKAVRDATEEAIIGGVTKFGGYDHPIYFLQHMLWHEGYHYALVMLALRNVGVEPTEEWEEQHVWGLWRVEEWEG